MIVRFPLFHLLACALVGLGLAAGCGKNEPSPTATSTPAEKAVTHDHGDGSGAHSHGDDPHDVKITEADVKKPTDFKDAVARVKEYRKEIEVKAGGDVPGKAHRPLDELEIVLKWLPGIARDSNVPKDQWETINTTAQQLRELFEKVHQNIDNKKNPDFPGVAKGVDEGIGRLEAAAQAKAKP
jgi:hypothetical protein